MRICLICTEKLPVPPIRGGAIQTYIAGVLPFLSARHQVTVVGKSDPLLPDIEEAGGVRYVRVPAGQLPEDYYRYVCAFLETQEFDLVEVFNRPLHLLKIARAAPGARMLLSMHNHMFAPNRIPADEARSVLDRACAVVTISDHVRTTIDELHPGYADKMVTIRSGVDTGKFLPWWKAKDLRRHVRHRLGLNGRQVVLHVSRFSPVKGNHLVLQAMEQVRREHPRTALLMVGSRWYGANDLNDYTLRLYDMAAELNGAVRFTGFIPPDQITELFVAGDLFVCASQWEEPLARVHYEAMAAGLPIITTDRGGNAEVMEEFGNGLIARPYDDPQAFARCISLLCSDRALRERMGRRGRELAEQRYTFARTAAELLEVIERCGSS